MHTEKYSNINCAETEKVQKGAESQLWGTGSVIRRNGSQVTGAGSELRRDPPSNLTPDEYSTTSHVRSSAYYLIWFVALKEKVCHRHAGQTEAVGKHVDTSFFEVRLASKTCDITNLHTYIYV